MPTQLTIKRLICDAYVKLDDCRAKLEEAQSDIQELDIEDPDQAEILDQLWSDVEDALVAIYQVDQLITGYVTA